MPSLSDMLFEAGVQAVGEPTWTITYVPTPELHAVVDVAPWTDPAPRRSNRVVRSGDEYTVACDVSPHCEWRATARLAADARWFRTLHVAEHRAGTA